MSSLLLSCPLIHDICHAHQGYSSGIDSGAATQDTGSYSGSVSISPLSTTSLSPPLYDEYSDDDMDIASTVDNTLEINENTVTPDNDNNILIKVNCSGCGLELIQGVHVFYKTHVHVVYILVHVVISYFILQRSGAKEQFGNVAILLSELDECHHYSSSILLTCVSVLLSEDNNGKCHVRYKQLIDTFRTIRKVNEFNIVQNCMKYMYMSQ